MMGMLPNPVKELGEEMNRRTWTLIIVIAALVVSLFSIDRRHSKKETALTQRIEALEKGKP